MKLELIKVINGDDLSNKWELSSIADIAYCYDNSGKRYILSKINFNLGQCNCCTLNAEIIKYEFYKIIE